jgi:hypothetical protein
VGWDRGDGAGAACQRVACIKQGMFRCTPSLAILHMRSEWDRVKDEGEFRLFGVMEQASEQDAQPATAVGHQSGESW